MSHGLQFCVNGRFPLLLAQTIEADQRVGNFTERRVDGPLIGDQHLALLRLGEPHLVANLPGMKDRL